jgi:hypothetical protein
VGDRVRVQPIGTDVQRGFIDFAQQEEDPKEQWWGIFAIW